jgi:hypothetical protein
MSLSQHCHCAAPLMNCIGLGRGWRRAFESPTLPFIYVELCTEYSMPGFWAAQVSN